MRSATASVLEISTARSRRVIRVLCGALVVTPFLIAGCDGRGPSTSTRPPQSPTSPPAPAQPTVTALRVSGPTAISPGTTAQFTATADYADGSSADVTAEASWVATGPTYPAPMQFLSAGAGLAGNRGEVNVNASYRGKVARLSVFILEPGTFKLSGKVTAPDGATLTYIPVTVEVVSGTGASLKTVTDRSEYALYGVAGRIQVRASAENLAPQVRDIVVSDNDAKVDFALPLLDTLATVGGGWTMTVAPSASCAAPMPEIAQGRMYHLELIQQGVHLEVSISSPTLEPKPRNPETGTIIGSRLRFVFGGDTGYGDWSTPSFYDRLSPTERFGFDGWLDGSVNGAEIRMALDGDLTYWSAGSFAPVWYCRAKDHIVTIRR